MSVRVHLHNSLLYIENAYGHLAMTIACLSSRLSLSQREERLVMTAYAALARRAAAPAIAWTPTAGGQAWGRTGPGVAASPAARSLSHPSPCLLVGLLRGDPRLGTRGR